MKKSVGLCSIFEIELAEPLLSITENVQRIREVDGRDSFFQFSYLSYMD